MAQIVLSEVGAVVGSHVLPGGVSILGQQIAGQAIGRALGSVAGRAIDTALFSDDISGPRLKSLHVMESREGAGIPSVYGRMRVGGHLLWAARFKETRRENSAGGKGGPTVTEFRYSVSFAVGICEGSTARIDRIWANGELLDPATVTMRVYPGTDDQSPDPIIQTIEGASEAPAYRGLCYVVFEDLPLGPYGNRLPQLSFEVVRVPPGNQDLSNHVTGVNIIPASGEFAYSTDVIRTRQFPGIERPQNANSGEGRADFVRSLEQLREELPSVSAAALTVAWFGDDLRAGSCRIRPGVETREKVTRPHAWQAGDESRQDAYLISKDDTGRSNYGGTPADWSVIQAIQAQHTEGISVTVSPFLLMDVPPGNGLPDPYGQVEQAPFPWRGRITSAGDKTASARLDCQSFLGQASVSDFTLENQFVRYSGPRDDHGYRRFVLHLAWLAKAAGGVSGFLLGSELRGLTRLRDETGAFPFVEGLRQLAADVRQILGAHTTITYAADWTEYGAYSPGDGTNDVLFPLDALWSDPNIDLVAIDWYPPAGDWRQGTAHLDAEAGFRGPGDADYLVSQFAGGENYDWYYANGEDRDAQVRTPINDTAHGEHWVFRAKDLANWWGEAHHERPGGVRQPQPTAWVPGSKQIRLAEIGFPAVDLGTNAPNLFYDPKSSESAVPPYSSGVRDDVLQRQALVASLSYFQALPFIERAFVWCWDARPFPAFPERSNVWGDGDNWRFGHWLNGRTGLATLSAVASDIAARGGVEGVDTSALDGVVEGYALDGVTTVRRALEPLRIAHDFVVQEGERHLALTPVAELGPATTVEVGSVAAPGIEWTDTLLDGSPGRATLTAADPANGFLPLSVEARIDGADPRKLISFSLPLALSAPEAERVAQRLLSQAQPKRLGSFSVPISRQDLGLGSIISFAGDVSSEVDWRVTAVSDGLERALTLEPFSLDYNGLSAPPLKAISVPSVGEGPPLPAAPELLIIDAPRLPGTGDEPTPLVAASADPWPGEVAIEAGAQADTLSVRATVTAPALMGVLKTDLPIGPIGRWDKATTLDIEFSEAALTSVSDEAVLSGANLVLIETANGWEMVGFQSADLVEGRTYRLGRLLRGLQGSAAVSAPAGSRCVFLDHAIARATLSRDEQGLTLIWRAKGGDSGQTQTFANVQGNPWPVAHLRSNGEELSWFRRHPDNSDSWILDDVSGPETYQVQWERADGTTDAVFVTHPYVQIDPDAVTATVAEVGADGRIGPPVSLSLQA
ncbi:MAG: glycoside hydrolase/phage tail family protein [Pseudomonadota bacterium]